MAAENEAGTPKGPGAPLDLRGGVPDERLASRDLLVLGGVEVAHTRYLPSEMEVPPLRGHTVNLRLGGKGRVVTRFGGRTHDRLLVAGLVEVFTGYDPLEWALEGSVSDNVNVRDPTAERILMLFLEEVRSGGLGGELYAPCSGLRTTWGITSRATSPWKRSRGLPTSRRAISRAYPGLRGKGPAGDFSGPALRGLWLVPQFGHAAHHTSHDPHPRPLRQRDERVGEQLG